MSDKPVPPPRYTIWQAVAVAISLAQRALEEVRAFIKDGGKPGPPGLGFEDLEVDYDGERRLTLRFARGEQSYEKTIVLPMMIYRGIHGERTEYELGDVTTWAGSTWHCRIATTAAKGRPKENTDAWQLIVKAGRDGRDGKPGEKGAPGPEGRPGRDLTQLGPDGRKW